MTRERLSELWDRFDELRDGSSHEEQADFAEYAIPELLEAVNELKDELAIALVKPSRPED